LVFCTRNYDDNSLDSARADSISSGSGSNIPLKQLGGWFSKLGYRFVGEDLENIRLGLVNGKYWDQLFSTPGLRKHLVMVLILRGNKIIPKRWQAAMESIYNHFGGLVKDNSGEKYFPFVLTLFIFIVCYNILGLFPYVFTVTAHVVVTLGLSCSIIMGVTKGGLWKFKWNFLSILMPAGAPLVLTPLLALIETVSYMSRVISLGVRLAANLSAGHLLFAILAGFCFNMTSFIIILPVLIMVFISLLESAVAVIQAYVFSLLTSIYLTDTQVLH